MNGNKLWFWKILKSFHRMYKKTTWLSAQSSKQDFLSKSSLSKNPLEPLFVFYQVQEVVKAKFWWEYLIIWISSPFLGIQQVIITFQELLLISTSGWHCFDFLFVKCYELKLLGLSNKTTLVLSNTRELDRELFYKLVYLI